MKQTMVPFVKWVGGKRQLLPELLDVFKTLEYKGKYHEPFLGGGAVFFNMISNNKIVSSINDLNSDLVNVYKVIKDNPKKLMSELDKLQTNHSRTQYYLIRWVDRESGFDTLTPTKKAARFIYLNKTSFNGIYRVNSKGQFNVPIGFIGTKKIYDRENLLRLSKKLNELDIKIYNETYQYIKGVAKKGDLVYFDPPYDSFEEAVNFVGYQKEGFNRESQKQLKELCDALINKGVNVVISNHNTKFIKELYKDKRYEYKQVEVEASRSLNADPANRKKRKIEVIIYGKAKK